MSELTAPVLKQDRDKRMVFGPVLIPDEVDTDGDRVSAEKIEDVAHKFMEDYGNIDLQHSLNNVGKTIESYVAPVDLEYEGVSVPEGSWMMGVRVNDSDTWDAVKDGSLSGFSIMGIPKASTKSKGVEKNEALKRTTLNDLGDDWTVNAVSLVDEPAVPKAKWVAIKSKNKESQGEITQETISKALEGSLEHRRDLVENEMDEVFWTMDQIPFVHSTMEDHLIMRVHNDVNGGVRYMRVDYSIGENGEVEFTGDPQEVRIEEQVVPVESSDSSQVLMSNSRVDTPSVDKEAEEVIADGDKAIKEYENDRSNKSVIEKIADVFGLKSYSEKAGRQISQSNFQKLGEVKERIDDIYDRAEVERSSDKSKEDDEMNENDVKQMIKSEISGIEGQLKELVDAYKTEKSQSDEDQSNEGGDGAADDLSTKSDDGDQGEDESVSKEEYDEAMKQLDDLKKRRPLSQRLAGQDHMEDGQEASKSKGTGRDAFGFKKSSQ